MHRLIAYSAGTETLQARTGHPAFCYRLAVASELDALISHPDYGAAAMRYLRGRLAAGDWLVLGESDGQLAFTGWCAIGAVEVGGRMAPVAPHVGFCYKLFTLPAYRRRGAFAGFYGYVAGRAAEMGVTTLIATVAAGNLPSRTAHERLGFEECGRILVRHLGGGSLAIVIGPLGSTLGRRVVAGTRRD